MNTIMIDEHPLKIMRIKQPIFRADRTTYTIGSKASNNYKNAPMKYFTLNNAELKAYTKYGMPYKKKWQPTSELILIDILDLSTRKNLEKIIGEESLKIAFPIKNDRVSRVSEEHTKIHDDKVLKAICTLNGENIDGYYMKRITEKTKNNNNNEEQEKYVFHSEVGLCPKAFEKLQLEKVERSKNYAPNITLGRKRSRFERNNNSNNNSNNTRKRKFAKISMNNNNIPLPKIKRLSLLDQSGL
jgi:hypothetical protein